MMSRSRDKANPFPARVVGSGPIRVVVGHGWMGGHKLFEPLFDRIDGDRYSYAFLDARGYGARAEEGGPRSVEAIAWDMIAVADGLGWSRFHVVGHSMAGMSAQRLTADRPERIASAILLASVPASGAAIDDDRRARLMRATSSVAERRELIDLNMSRRQPAVIVDRILSISLESTHAEAMTDYLTSWADTDFHEAVIGAAVPVLALVGALDPGATSVRMRDTIMAWYPHSTLREIAAAGHYPMLEAPDALIAELDSWLSRQEG